MRIIRTHFSQVPQSVFQSDLPGLTEQSHAKQLDIRTMMRSGFRFSSRQPIWDDVTQIPSLDVLLMNRRRLQSVYDSLPAKVKVDIPSLDEFVRVLSTSEAETLVDLGLLSPSVLEKPVDEQQVFIDRLSKGITAAINPVDAQGEG